jgi:hypothetical protein
LKFKISAPHNDGEFGRLTLKGSARCETRFKKQQLALFWVWGHGCCLGAPLLMSTKVAPTAARMTAMLARIDVLEKI